MAESIKLASINRFYWKSMVARIITVIKVIARSPISNINRSVDINWHRLIPISSILLIKHTEKKGRWRLKAMKNIESIDGRKITDNPTTYWVNSESLVAVIWLWAANNPTFATVKSTIAVKKPMRRFPPHSLLPTTAHPLRFISVNLFLSVFLLMSRSFKKTPIAWMNFTVFTPFGKLSKFCSIWYLVQVMMQSETPLASPARNLTSLCSQSAFSPRYISQRTSHKNLALPVFSPLGSSFLSSQLLEQDFWVCLEAYICSILHSLSHEHPLAVGIWYP